MEYPACKAGALPAELHAPYNYMILIDSLESDHLLSALSSISVESRLEGSPGHGNSLAMHLLGGEQEAAQHLLAVLGVAASGETAQVAPQVFEPTFAQVGGA